MQKQPGIPTVSELINYLAQFDGNLMVTLDEETANDLPQGDFLSLNAFFDAFFDEMANTQITIWVYDGNEDRCWGPFEDDDDANRFIESDKYLESWCAVQGRPNGRQYPPSEYHGRWPL
jgi:hypothetical protein